MPSDSLKDQQQQAMEYMIQVHAWKIEAAMGVSPPAEDTLNSCRWVRGISEELVC